MRYFGQDDIYITAECPECNKVLRVKRKFVIENDLGFEITPIFKCFCGADCAVIDGKSKTDYIPKHEIAEQRTTDNAKQIKCPKCTSTQVSAIKKGFGLGKAVAGGVLLGHVGLLGGLIGSNKIEVVCLNCGNKWKPGQ